MNVFKINRQAKVVENDRPVLRVVSVAKVEADSSLTPLPIEAPNNLISFKAGETVQFDIQVEAPDGSVLPISNVFTLPLAGQMGTSPRIIDVAFVNGVASLSVGNWTSGRWAVTEEEVNIDLGPNEPRFSFEGLTIKVSE